MHIYIKNLIMQYYISSYCVVAWHTKEVSSRPARGHWAPLGWNMQGAHVVNDRVVHYVGFLSVSLSVRLLSCLTGWSGTTNTHDQIQNSIYLLPRSPSCIFLLSLLLFLLLLLNVSLYVFTHWFFLCRHYILVSIPVFLMYKYLHIVN